MRVLGIVPARGGSKGVPRKNIKWLGRKPLLQYTAEAALGARLLAMLSTIIIEILSNDVGAKIQFILEGYAYLFFNIDERRGPVRRLDLTVDGLARHSRNFLLCKLETARNLGLV